MSVNDSLEHLSDSLAELLTEGRAVQASLIQLRNGEGDATPGELRSSLEELARSVSDALDGLHDRLRRMHEVLRGMCEDSE